MVSGVEEKMFLFQKKTSLLLLEGFRLSGAKKKKSSETEDFQIHFKADERINRIHFERGDLKSLAWTDSF